MRTATISKMRWVLISVLCLALAGCDNPLNEASVNRKLIVELQTPDGVIVGSSVAKIRAKTLTKYETFASGGNVASINVDGEAAVIRLANGKYLFALKSLEAGEFYRLLKAWGINEYRALDFADNLRFIEEQGGRKFLTSNNYHRFAIFDDIDDSSSLRLLDPNDLDDVLGCSRPTKSKPWREKKTIMARLALGTERYGFGWSSWAGTWP